VPCRLCWFQRITMYPLAAVLLVGALRRDSAVRWYVLPIAGAGALVAGYHYLIEWEVVEDNACSLTGPSCAAVWFREFGFVSLALMALVGFLTILALLFVRFPATMDDDAGETPPSAPARQEVAS
ncbi:MAG: disulfide bond formation protein B, partial [Ilumatobacteraceae bacterium]